MPATGWKPATLLPQIFCFLVFLLGVLGNDGSQSAAVVSLQPSNSTAPTVVYNTTADGDNDHSHGNDPHSSKKSVKCSCQESTDNKEEEEEEEEEEGHHTITLASVEHFDSVKGPLIFTIVVLLAGASKIG